MNQNWKKKLSKMPVFWLFFEFYSITVHFGLLDLLIPLACLGARGDIIVLILVFDIFLRQRHLVKFFILFKLKVVVTFIDATRIKKWQYHFSEPQWPNFLNFKFIPLLFWCLQQCSAVHFWKSELYLGWFWFLIQTLTNTK